MKASGRIVRRTIRHAESPLVEWSVVLVALAIVGGAFGFTGTGDTGGEVGRLVFAGFLVFGALALVVDRDDEG